MQKLFSLTANKKLEGDVVITGDKSISHRALIFASMMIGLTKIIGLSKCLDVMHTLKSLKKLGVQIKFEDDLTLVDGNGILSLSPSDDILFVGNSATSARLLMGLVSSFDFSTSFTGDNSLNKRPMGRVIEPLSAGLARISSRNGLLPITICGSKYPLAINYDLEIPSSQVKSSIILSGLNLGGETIIRERIKSRDHTEIMMQYLGYDIDIQGEIIKFKGLQEIKAKDIEIAGDPSSAIFLIAAALLIKDSDIIIRNVCVNDTRMGAYKVLLLMGADLEFFNPRKISGEKISDIRAKYSKLKGVNIEAKLSPFMIDEYPIIAALAAFAEGETKIYGLSELKYKETDRLNAIFRNLRKGNIECSLEADNLFIKGTNYNIKGDFIVNVEEDHRIAMSFLIMGLASKKPIYVDNISVIDNSFPEFIEFLEIIGADMREING